MFETSPETEKLDAALAKAQGEMTSAKKDATNPQFGSKYADLSSVIDSCRAALAKHGISVTQWPVVSPTGAPGIHLITRLAHGGQWMKSMFVIPVAQVTAQGIGSAITYGKRYALAAALCIAAEDDDDGNAASAGYQPPQRDRQAPAARGNQAAPQGGNQRQGNQRAPQGGKQNDKQKAPAADQKEGPNLEHALKQIDKTKNPVELERVRGLLRGLAWSPVEKRTLLGAIDAKGKTFGEGECPDCGLAGGEHRPPCDPQDRAPLPEPGYNG